MSKKLDKIKNLIQEGQREYRDMKIEVIQSESNEEEKSYRVHGYATTFNEPYPLFSYRTEDGYVVKIMEQMDGNAFNETDMSDVIMQYNHEGRVFARQSNGTLSLAIEKKGLAIEADLGGTTIGRQLYEEIDGNYTSKVSIGFTVEESSMEPVESDGSADEMYLRTIKRVGKLYDVSAVSLPANDFTSISARTVCDGVIAEVEAERLQAKKREEQRKRLQLRLQVMKGE